MFKDNVSNYDLINVIVYAYNKDIINEAWGILKPKATDEDLINLIGQVDNEDIVEEAKELLESSKLPR